MFYFSDFAFFMVQTLILVQVLVLQCSTRLATCNFSENELMAKFASVFYVTKITWYTVVVHGKHEMHPLTESNPYNLKTVGVTFPSQHQTKVLSSQNQ